MVTIFDDFELTTALIEEREISLHVARNRASHVLALLQRTDVSLGLGEERQRLSREAGILRQLSTVPGIAQFQSIHQGTQGDALTLNYFSGTTLKQQVQSQIPDLSQFFEWALKLTELVERLHLAGFLHRNLNPQALLVDPAGQEFLLMDFRLASRLNEVRRAARADAVHDWTCMAPEQTGRTTAFVDHRTDYYSLGMVLLFVLKASPALPAANWGEAVHAHLAKTPTPPTGCPLGLAALLNKLTAKDPNQRYQSITGLLHDLHECQKLWTSEGQVPAFPLGSADHNEQIQPLRALHGREAELGLLRRAFEQVGEGRPATVVLSGASGVGKSSLASEVGSWAAAQNGFFLAGKFDDARERPYSVLIQHVEDLVRQIVQANQQAQWRGLFAEALKSNQAVITDLVPAFEQVVGPQPALEELSPRETENRFRYSLETLFHTLNQASGPIVLFMDDLQWVDAASASWLEFWGTAPSLKSFLILYSYRTQEPKVSHAFEPLLSRIRDAQPLVVPELGPLSSDAIQGWLADALGRSVRAPDQLAQLLFVKTAGNPFFLTQLVHRLHRETVLRYDRKNRQWDWNSKALQDLPASETINDLLIAQFEQLSPASMGLLGMAACLGTTVQSKDLPTLGDLVPHLHEALGPLIDLQYLVPLSDDYLAWGSTKSFEDQDLPSFSFRFQHDRIRQAVYEKLDPRLRQRLHLELARNFEAQQPIESAAHYLVAGGLDPNSLDLAHVTGLLIRAGERARASSATQQALDFFLKAWEWDQGKLLPTETSLHLQMLLAETAFLCHDITLAEATCSALLSRLPSASEQAEVFMMAMDAYTFLGRFEEALGRGQQALALLGASLKIKPNPLALAQKLIQVLAKASRRKTDQLLTRQGNVDETLRFQLRLLGKFLVPAQMSGNVNLFVLSTLMTANLALDHGNSDETSGAFGNFAILLSVLGRHQQAFEYATLALKLEEGRPNPKTAPSVHSAFAFFSLPWNRPWEEFTSASHRGAEAAIVAGDLFYTAYQTLFAVVFAAPPRLEDAISQLEAALKTIRNTRQYDAWIGGMFALQRWRSLAGELENPGALSELGFDEAASIADWTAKKNLSGLAVYHLYKTQTFFHLDRFEEAWEEWNKAQTSVTSIHGSAYMEDMAVYGLLVCAEHASVPQRRKQALSKMKSERIRLSRWAKTCPQNFAALATLAQAEEAAAQGRRTVASGLYRQAVSAARDNTGLHIRWKALVFERAAKHCYRTGDTVLGHYLAGEAYQFYGLWGAKAKLKCLELEFRDLRRSVGATTSSWANDGESSLWKVSQVIAREINIDKLLELVIQTVIEHAGAQQGWLLLNEGEGWHVAVRGRSDGPAVALGPHVSPEHEGIPHSFLPKAAQTGSSSTIHSASSDPRYALDPQVKGRQIKAVMTLGFAPPGAPFQALWYLENNLVEGAFSDERVSGLKLISGQVGVSLENARMYRTLAVLNRDLEGKVRARTEELEERNRQFVQAVDYAAVLQGSLIPKEWGAGLKDKFLLWRPKEGVGGDLFWYRETSESCLAAVYDCTGHGIPGSLITTLVHSMLEEAWSTCAQGDVGAILARVNGQFRKALGQDKPGSESNDGFDIGLLWWSSAEKKARFAGARISLLCLEGSQVTWVAGDRRSLGYPETPHPLQSTAHELSIGPGTRYYLTTDGYLTQVGGEKGISMGRQGLSRILIETNRQTLPAQGRLLQEAFDVYRGARPQADDLTVLGVELS